MEEQLTPERADRIISLLRDNPGVSMTLTDISDETEIEIAALAAHLADLAERGVLYHEISHDGVDLYSFPQEFQRGSMAP